MPRKLLVIISDRLSELIAKGEVVSRYYNPGECFDEVHIILTNDDKPDPKSAQRLAGRAKLFFYNLPFGKREFLATLGMRPGLMAKWARRGVELAEKIGPSLVRVHGVSANGYLAWAVKKNLGIPYVASLHTNPPEVPGLVPFLSGEWMFYTAQRSIEGLVLSHADAVVCVYGSTRGYAERAGAGRVHVIHNVINPDFISPKTDYTLASPPRLVSVGRHIALRDPSPIIEGVAGVPGATLTLVGSGPLTRGLRALARRLDAGERVNFIESLSNDQVMAMLKDFDAYVFTTRLAELSKGVLEAMLTGLPVIHSRHPWYSPEYLEDAAIFVENTAQGFKAAIQRVLEDRGLREDMGQSSLDAAENVRPGKMEAKLAELYREIIHQGGG